MRKKNLKHLLTGTLLLSLVVCGGSSVVVAEDSSVSTSESTEAAETATEAETVSESGSKSIEEFEALLAEQPLSIISTEYVVQDDNYKALYPDMLQAVLQNNTTSDIKNAVVAFVAWDSNNLPVKIKGKRSFDDGAYIQQVNYADINLVAGATYGEEQGYQIDENCGIASFKAIVVSFETFDGETWENPYYSAFCTLYEGQKFSSDMTVEVEVVDSSFAPGENEAGGENASADTSELEANLASLPILITDTEYVVQDEKYKALYPDMLQVILQNNTGTDIKDAVIAFVAWDKNGLPVKIEGRYDYSGGAYLMEVNYNDINLAAGMTFGDNYGLSLSEDNNIDTFKAIVVSYVTFDGETWENPYYADFSSAYAGQRLN